MVEVVVVELAIGIVAASIVWASREHQQDIMRLDNLARAIRAQSPEQARVTAREGGRKYAQLLGALRGAPSEPPDLPWRQLWTPGVGPMVAWSLCATIPLWSPSADLGRTVSLSWIALAALLPLGASAWAHAIHTRVELHRRLTWLVLEVTSYQLGVPTVDLKPLRRA